MDLRPGRWNAAVRLAAWTAILLAVPLGAFAVVRTHAPHLVGKSRVFHFYMRKASGVEVGTPVWVTGVEAGKVIALEPAVVPATRAGGLPAEGKIFAVKFTCRVFPPYHRLIRDGSCVEILLLSMLGSPRVDVFPGQPGSPRAPDGAILSQRVTRGAEGAVEQLLDAGQRMDANRNQMIYFLDEIEKNLDEITDAYESGGNSLHSLLDKRADRKDLLQIGESLESSAADIKASIENIECDVKCLDPATTAEIEEALRAAAADFEAVAENGADIASAIPRLIDEGEKASDIASSTSRKIRTFNYKFRTLLEAQSVYMPDILADWECIRVALIVRGLMNMRTAMLFQPGVEEILRFMYRGRLEAAARRRPGAAGAGPKKAAQGVADRDGMK